MKLNHECVRELLLYCEEELDYNQSVDLNDINIGYKIEDLIYTTKKLKEAGYINAEIVKNVLDEIYVYIHDITWEGHKFLDTIRDNEVWSTTKKVLSKVSSASITFVSTVASQVLQNIIQQNLTQFNVF